jgi:hypothetical protein
LLRAFESIPVVARSTHGEPGETLTDLAHGRAVLREVHSVGAHGQGQIRSRSNDQDVSVLVGHGSKLLEPLEALQIGGGASRARRISIPDPEQAGWGDRREASYQAPAAL